jgi:hypothetical protein
MCLTQADFSVTTLLSVIYPKADVLLLRLTELNEFRQLLHR